LPISPFSLEELKVIRVSRIYLLYVLKKKPLRRGWDLYGMELEEY